MKSVARFHCTGQRKNAPVRTHMQTTSQAIMEHLKSFMKRVARFHFVLASARTHLFAPTYKRQPRLIREHLKSFMKRVAGLHIVLASARTRLFAPT